MLKIDDVSAGYGKLRIIDGISLDASPKEITVIVGPNGSGKSTILRTVSGLTTVYGGRVMLDEREITGLTPNRIARLGVAYLPQTENVFTNLTVNENLRLACYTVAKGEQVERIKSVIDLFPQLSAYQRTKAGNLSGGERQMLAMAMALTRKPTIMMFDEPTANLSPKIAMQVLRTISSLAREMGLTVLLVEQNARKALEIGDRAYLLANGRAVFTGGAKELLEHRELGRLYLGLAHA